MKLQLKMKISLRHWSSALDCLSGGEKKKCLWSQDEKKKKQETKTENKLWASHCSLSHGGPPSPRISHTLMRKRRGRRGGGRGKKTFWCFSYLTFSFYLPCFHALDRGVLLRGDEALRVFNGFFILRRLKSLSSGSSQVFRSLTSLHMFVI